MKALILSALMVMVTCSAFAFSDTSAVIPFSNYSGTSATHYSSAYYVGGFKTKTMSADFTTGSATGTFLVQCGPTSNGPWTTCLSPDNSTAISTTTSKNMTWQGASSYIRASWARTAGKFSAWIGMVSE